MEPLRFRDGDHYFEEHSGRLARGTKETRRGTSSQPEQGNNRDFKERDLRNYPV
jgi:hypothetical protein